MRRTCETTVSMRWPTRCLSKWGGVCNQWCYINKYFPFWHPQVCTPVFDGCQSRSTICPPGASRGLIRKGGWFGAWTRSPVGVYVPEEKMLVSQSRIVCWTVDGVEHNQTRLKLNCVIRSTLYIQVEECQFMSQYHHYAWRGGREGGGAGKSYLLEIRVWTILQEAYEAKRSWETVSQPIRRMRVSWSKAVVCASL